MGKVRLTGGSGEVTTVDKTAAFVRDDATRLRIVLHHPSLPFSGGCSAPGRRARGSPPGVTRGPMHGEILA